MGSSSAPLSACPGCGLELPERDGPTHAYIGASPACWALYGELLAREYDDFGTLGGVHRLAVDAYAVQHPGVPERRAIRSVALHLVRLCLMLERGVGPDDAARLMVTVGERIPDLRWLEPPQPNGTVTVRDAHGAPDADEHRARIEGWGRDVWAAWSPHHETVRGWIDGALRA